jgi:Tol biopolymer transport system component
VLVLVGGAVAVCAAVVVWATRSSTPGRIVFQAKVGGLYQLFTIKPDGTDLRQVTRLVVRGSGVPGVERPHWSPDGKRIVFDSDYDRRGGHVVSLFTIGPDGAGMERLALAGEFDGDPAWSSSGKMVAFTYDASNQPGHLQGIDIANADGTEQLALTKVDHETVLFQRPTWSPGDEWIAFIENSHNGQSAIYKVQTAGSEPVELTRWPLNANNPKWSPDGTRILFNSHNEPQAGQDANLYTVDPDGTHLVQLTHYRGGHLHAYAGGWSPDSKKIVFQIRGTNSSGRPVDQLFTADADGSHQQPLTHLPDRMNPSNPSWR